MNGKKLCGVQALRKLNKTIKKKKNQKSSQPHVHLTGTHGNELSNLTFIKFYLHSHHSSDIKNKLFSNSPLISILIVISSSSLSSSLFFIFFLHRAQHPYQPNLEFRSEWNRMSDISDLNKKLNRWFN